jgi:hypothetical protein
MKKSELRNLIFEAYREVLAEQAEMPTATDELLGKFPTLRRTVVNLLTKQYDSFIDTIDWVAPKPSTFRVVLKNGQAFYLRWTGADFQAQIEGKRYMLAKVEEYQQALDRLTELLKHEKPEPQPDMGADSNFDEPGGGAEPAADFGSTETPEDIPGEEPEAEEPGSEELEFEEPGEEPT